MKLYEAGAILLMVGEAVIGPIQPKSTWTEPAPQLEAECLATWEPRRPFSCNGYRGAICDENGTVWTLGYYCKHVYGRQKTTETFDQTCERAMKQIGAEEQGVGFTGKPEPKEVFRWFVDGLRVRCIPAPSGLH